MEISQKLGMLKRLVFLTSWNATIREANQGIERGMLIEVGRDARLRELVKGGSHLQDPKFCSTKYGKLLSLTRPLIFILHVTIIASFFIHGVFHLLT